jgi:uncharacterized metal-binding protein
MKGAAHGIITIGLAGSIIYAASYIGAPKEIALQVTAGCLLGLLVTPDLDQAEIGTLKRPWLIPWWLYGKLFKHRSFLSHFPAIGTLIRVIYGIALIALASRFIPIHVQIPYGPWIFWSFVGLIVADTGHYITDILSTFILKLGRR